MILISFGIVIECVCIFSTLCLTSTKNASTLNDIDRKRQCLFCFFLCFRLLAITGDGLLSQNSVWI